MYKNVVQEKCEHPINWVYKTNTTTTTKELTNSTKKNVKISPNLLIFKPVLLSLTILTHFYQVVLKFIRELKVKTPISEKFTNWWFLIVDWCFYD